MVMPPLDRQTRVAADAGAVDDARNEAGFTLAELLVVAVLGAVILGAVFQTLSLQNRTYQQQSAVIAAQEASRTTLSVLAGELREISSTGQDLLAASADSVTIRAFRDIGFACRAGQPASLAVWELGQPFVAGDSVLVFSQGTDLVSPNDDEWIAGILTTVTRGATPAGCATDWEKTTLSGVADGDHEVALFAVTPAKALTDVGRGAPVRSFEVLTYGRYTVDGEEVLGRKEAGAASVTPLVGPLASGTEGLEFRYFDKDDKKVGGGGAVAAADLDDVSYFTIGVQGRQAAGSAQAGGFYGDSLTVSVFLRNNTQSALN